MTWLQATKAQIAFIQAYPTYAEKVRLCDERRLAPIGSSLLTLCFLSSSLSLAVGTGSQLGVGVKILKREYLLTTIETTNKELVYHTLFAVRSFFLRRVSDDAPHFSDSWPVRVFHSLFLLLCLCPSNVDQAATTESCSHTGGGGRSCSTCTSTASAALTHLRPAHTPLFLVQAAGQYLAFGGEDGFFYSTTEPPHIRHPDPLVRVSRFAARLRSILHAPGVLITQARLVNDDGGRGLVVGMAVWHRPGAPVKNIMACDGHEEEEMWQGVDVKQWDGWLNGWDARRKEVLGEEKHWYVALCALSLVVGTFARKTSSREIIPRCVAGILVRYGFYQSTKVEASPHN